jgi:hypothetical protein
MPIQIGINNAIKGGTGTGTGGGGGGAVFTGVFDVTTLAGETVSFYTLSQTEPAIVDWGDGSPTETINLSVLQTHTYPAGSYVISISGGAVKLYYDPRVGQSDLSKVTNVLSLSKLIFGESSSLYTCPVNVTYTATDTPVINGPSVLLCFPPDADNYPTSIPNWQVGSVDDFSSVFEVTSPSTLDVDVSSWVFKTGATITSSFQYLIDARIAECFVGWDASGVTNVFLSNAFRPRFVSGGVDLDPATYPAAKVAYDNLINTKGWVDNGSVNWVAPNLLLDDYPVASAGYSVRLLSNAYAGSAMRVRRAVAPFDETDIGFTAGGDLDEAAIVAFGGSDSLTVSVWYDQSGSSNDASQATATTQPQIYDGAAVITDNGKPAIYFTPDKQLASNFGNLSILSCDVVSVSKRVSGIGYPLFWYNGIFQVARYSATSYFLGWFSGTVVPTIDTNQHLDYIIANNGAGTIRRDTTAYTGTLQTNRYFSGLFAFNGRPGAAGSYATPTIYHQEFIQWNSNQSGTDTSDIESNVNTYFSIY